MYRTLCVLAMLTLQAGLGLAYSFSWDIVAAPSNQLEFYYEGRFTHSVMLTDVDVDWITYDPLHNRILLMKSSKSLLSFDIATEKIQTLIDFRTFPALSSYAYDPVTGLFFAVSESYKVYSYLVKPGSNKKVHANFVIDLGEWCHGLAVDTCEGSIYWISAADSTIKKARLDNSEREELIGNSNRNKLGLTFDPQTQNIYWTECEYDSTEYFILSADVNGKQRRTIHQGQNSYPARLTVSKNFIYWTAGYSLGDKFFWIFPKNLPLGTDVHPNQFAYIDTPNHLGNRYIAAKYAIGEHIEINPLCKGLRHLLPNYSEANNSTSTGGNLLRVNETKATGESQVSGNTWNVPVCQYYCLQGHCSTSADGQPECRCNAGYSGARCEMNECKGYCLNDGFCSLSDENNPVCQCTGGYQGDRCDVPALLIKCSQTVSLLKDILNADLTSVTEGKGVKSTCASTVL